MGARHRHHPARWLSGSAPRAWIAWLCLLPALPASAAGVADGRDATTEIIVTGTRPLPLAEMPRSVTVITAQDIARSPATALAELLASEANLNLRSVTGNDKFAGIDIRGSGDTFVSNVLVLVDGARLNPPDLAGPDLASVALENIERIEIVRGANAVRYGSGAVGGVINIITRRSVPGSRLGAGASLGSFDTRELFAAAEGSGERAGGSARVAWRDSAGYRRNGGLEQLDVRLHADVHAGPRLDLDAGIDLHADEYGLPGPISREAFAGSSVGRRASLAPDDGGESRDNRYRAGARLALPAGQSLRLAGHFRDRQVDYVIGYTPLLEHDQQASRITERSSGLEAGHVLPWQLGRVAGELRTGLEWWSTDYSRSEGGYAQVGSSRELRSDLDGIAAWLSTSFSPAERWQLSAGYRADLSRLDSRRHALVESCEQLVIPGIPIPIPVNCRNEWVRHELDDKRWHNWAADLGLLFRAREGLQLFANLSRSFRVPNVDELALAPSGLEPQRAWHFDSGLRAQLHPAIGLTLTGFWSGTRDEILFGMDLASGEAVNLNADSRSERRGAELELRWQLLPTLELSANAGYTHARFAATGSRIPLVADWTSAAALHWTPRERLMASLGARRIGRRSDGNDFSGSNYPALDGYEVVDLRLGWQGRRLRWSAGVQNAFDTVAAASAYSGAIYPLAGRSFFVAVSAQY